MAVTNKTTLYTIAWECRPKCEGALELEKLKLLMHF